MPRKDPLRGIGTRKTPQRQKASPKQRENNAGGFSFTVTDEERLRRFLILGTDGGTFYVKERELTRANAEIVMKMAREKPRLLLEVIREVSVNGLAPKQNATLFAFAALMALGTRQVRSACKEEFNAIVRTGTHLFLFLNYVQQFRGWGRLLRESVSGWYLHRPVDRLAYQMVKYQEREGFSHRDALRLAHPKTKEAARQALFLWAVHRGKEDARKAPKKKELPASVRNFERLKKRPEKTLGLLRTEPEHGLSWEMLPTETLNYKETWKALLDSESVPLGALVRQLSRFTRIGLFEDYAWRGQICRMLTDQEAIERSRLHPLNLLLASRAYSLGRSPKGDTRWAPVAPVIDALDDAFHMAFKNVEPTGKRIRLALDVSGSMGWTAMPGGLTPRDGSAAMAMTTARVEDPYSYDIVGFTGGAGAYGYGRRSTGSKDLLTQLDISPKQRLRDAVKSVSDLPFGGTDCALPMIDALNKGLKFDAFVVYTDSETWAGSIHPHQALQRYRERTGIDAKLVVAGMTATEFTIADPEDSGMMDVVGFDASAPAVISNFIRGNRKEA